MENRGDIDSKEILIELIFDGRDAAGVGTESFQFTNHDLRILLEKILKDSDLTKRILETRHESLETEDEFSWPKPAEYLEDVVVLVEGFPKFIVDVMAGRIVTLVEENIDDYIQRSTAHDQMTDVHDT